MQRLGRSLGPWVVGISSLFAAVLERVHEERFEPSHGPLRSVARHAFGRLLDCGLLEHGFARVRCGACRAEFLVAFRCKGRHFCPSCHARRLAEGSLWLAERLLAPVAHRQVVLTLPKRLRAYFLPDRRRLGLLSRVAVRTLREYVQVAVGEREAVPGVFVCVQTFGSVAHLHPHLHVLMNDGAFRRDDARRDVRAAARDRACGAGGVMAARGARGVRAPGLAGGGGGGDSSGGLGGPAAPHAKHVEDAAPQPGSN